MRKLVPADYADFAWIGGKIGAFTLEAKKLIPQKLTEKKRRL